MVCIVVKLEQFRCVAHIAGNETEETLCQEDPPLLLGLVPYILMFLSAEEGTVGKSMYKRLDKCAKTKTVFEPILLPHCMMLLFF